ncbi:unnamed protein product [Mytilus coruscus]|uniref:EGF-like domain-containing protein n=1 Tax=Mytilus coruscus TaxID=42192 RepID=A0A6J8B0C4_MYTCO|nr:unnamed protein product [Mytilus coruscus]
MDIRAELDEQADAAEFVSIIDNNDGCSCRAGWTGRCCGVPCGDKIHGVNCSQSCECAEGLRCDQSTGQCVLRESLVITEDGRECQTCELRYWGSWGSCDQQCGGGMRIRYREVCCPEIIDYHTCIRETCRGSINLSDTVGKGSCNLDCYNGGVYNETCQCKPGWSGRCCETSMYKIYRNNNIWTFVIRTIN